jgi:putative DNA primase/helicase
MKGARFVHATETSQGQRLDDSVIKTLTGGDQITVRFLHREYFTYRPAFKLFLSANCKPDVRDNSHAMWRRIRMIPFLYRVEPSERIDGLAQLLFDEEGPGILTWCMEGIREWLHSKLAPPAEVLAATSQYRQEMDLVSQFVREKTRKGVRADKVETYYKFTEWSEGEGYRRAMTKNAFTRELDRLGYPVDPGDRHYVGIELVQLGDPEYDPDLR